jgi:hypothetical protein
MFMKSHRISPVAFFDLRKKKFWQQFGFIFLANFTMRNQHKVSQTIIEEKIQLIHHGFEIFSGNTSFEGNYPKHQAYNVAGI